MKQSYVYILAGSRNGTLYVGVTGDIIKRVWEHREGLAGGFMKKYRVHRLVYYEEFGDIQIAITREKQIKKWRRHWKMNLIARANPMWEDLYPTLLGGGGFPPARE